ncbi:MAG: hypothetical protein AB1633_08460 [Elusimicrobiota bacterium]
MKKILIITSIAILIILTILLPKLLKPKFDLMITPEKNEFYHYEFINIGAKLNKSKIKIPPAITITYKLRPVQTIGYKRNFKFNYDNYRKKWTLKWPCPWNAPDGAYKIIPLLTEEQKKLKLRVNIKNFKIISRDIPKAPSGLGVLTLENISPLPLITMKNPAGKMTDWRGLADWTEFVGADMFWCLGGSTSYHKNKLKDNFPFVEYNFPQLPKLADELHARGLKLGVWAIAYMTFGSPQNRPDYKYAWTYTDGKLQETRSISLSDKKRVDHLISFFKALDKIPGIDYYGLDYIRNALGGYELVDDFVREMEVETPSNWKNFSWEERVTWLAKKKIARTDKVLIDLWQWWRAHKVSHIIKRMKEEANIKKPFWAFTLSWDRGWQHGQDVKMFADAGVDLDAVMLYECNREQFNELIEKWNEYLSHKDANIIPGDVVDWPLHQNVLEPPGPAEFHNRTMVAVNKIYGDGLAKGVFLHDLGRALWGRLGPYTIYEWLLCGASAISDMRLKTKSTALSSTFETAEKNGKIEVNMIVKKHNLNIKNARVKFYNAREEYKTDENFDLHFSTPTEKSISFTFPGGNFTSSSGKKFIAVSIEWRDSKKNNRFTSFSYLR